MRWPVHKAKMAREREDLKSPTAPVLSLEDVYREHFDFVFRMAARLGGPSIDAEDAAQEVFLIVARKLDTYDGSSLVSTWLYGITLNIVRALRRRYRLRRFFERENEGEIDVPIQSVDRAEVREAHRIAYSILDKLAPKKREAFILAEFEGLTCDEIALMTGTREQTVWSRLHYARKEFAERLEKRQKGTRS
jgi:RNA polymerase sigma-70 factor (ECF subfamily)